MKAILTLILCLIFMGARAQSSGDLLRKAGGQMKAGFMLVVAGAAVTAGSSLSDYPGTQKGFVIVGGGLILAGGIVTFLGYNSLQRAGQALEREKRAGLLLTPSGFAYRF